MGEPIHFGGPKSLLAATPGEHHPVWLPPSFRLGRPIVQIGPNMLWIQLAAHVSYICSGFTGKKHPCTSNASSYCIKSPSVHLFAMSGTSDLQPCDHQQDTDNQDLVLEALGKCVQRGTDTLRLVTKEHSLLESLAATVNAIGAYVKALKTSTAGSSTARCGTSSAAGYGDR